MAAAVATRPSVIFFAGAGGVITELLGGENADEETSARCEPPKVEVDCSEVPELMNVDDENAGGEEEGAQQQHRQSPSARCEPPKVEVDCSEVPELVNVDGENAGGEEEGAQQRCQLPTMEICPTEDAEKIVSSEDSDPEEIISSEDSGASEDFEDSSSGEEEEDDEQSGRRRQSPSVETISSREKEDDPLPPTPAGGNHSPRKRANVSYVYEWLSKKPDDPPPPAEENHSPHKRVNVSSELLSKKPPPPPIPTVESIAAEDLDSAFLVDINFLFSNEKLLSDIWDDTDPLSLTMLRPKEVSLISVCGDPDLRHWVINFPRRDTPDNIGNVSITKTVHFLSWRTIKKDMKSPKDLCEFEIFRWKFLSLTRQKKLYTMNEKVHSYLTKYFKLSVVLLKKRGIQFDPHIHDCGNHFDISCYSAKDGTRPRKSRWCTNNRVWALRHHFGPKIVG